MNPSLRATIRSILIHPAGQTAIGLYAAGLLVLTVYGFAAGNFTVVVAQLFLTLWELVYLAITLGLTPNPPPDQPSKGRWLPLQLGLIAAVLIASQFIPQIATAANPPLSYSAINPIVYAVIPCVLLGGVFAVKPTGLGFRWGYRSIPVALVWISINLLFVVAQLVTSSFSPAWVANRIVGNVLQNGFAEEILWRGVIQTRLSLMIGQGWGLVITSLVFGVWHLNANLAMFDQQVLPALAFAVVSQARYGLFMGILFNRTRSIIAPGVAHTFANLNPLNFL